MTQWLNPYVLMAVQLRIRYIMPYGNKKKICCGVLHLPEAGVRLAAIGDRPVVSLHHTRSSELGSCRLDLPDADGVGGANLECGY